MEEKVVRITIPPLNERHMRVRVTGTAPFMMAKFSNKARQMIKDKHEAGSTATKGKKREPRDFAADCEAAIYRAADGRIGIPASCFRAAMIFACRVCGFKMTIAKLSVWIKHQFLDTEGTQLVPIDGEYVMDIRPARNASGVADLRSRPRWDEWSSTFTIGYDRDQFTDVDVCNLLSRAGVQVGVAEGRPNSKSSAGIGYGTFSVEVLEDVAA